MNLRDAMSLQVFLHKNDWLYHFDDCPRDCFGPELSDLQCVVIKLEVKKMLEANLDWGLFDDAFGFALALHNGELDQWLGSLSNSLTDQWKHIEGMK
jgi:hypothetical protein